MATKKEWFLSHKNAQKTTQKDPSSWGHKSITAYVYWPYGSSKCAHVLA
jgi:hypothetical protein